MELRLPIIAPIRRAIPRLCVWLLLGLSSYWAARLAWADHLSRDPEPAVRERALSLATAIAQFPERLADRREDLLLDSLPDRQRAAQLDPENADRLMRLGIRAELAGDYPLAERSLLGAAERSRLYQPKYLLAQFYFRRENPDRFQKWASSAMNAAYGDVAPLLDLCWRVHPDPAWLAANVLPHRPAITRQYLTFLIGHEQWGPALTLARSLGADAQAEDVPVLLQYCDARLANGSATDAHEIWDAMCLRRLLPGEPMDLARGFDWRPVRQPGVRYRAGDGAIRLSFSGRQPESCQLAWQYVPLEAGATYRLHTQVRAADALAAQSITWEVTGADIAGESTFIARRELGQVILVYRRPPGVARLEGRVDIAHIKLERTP